MKVSCVLFVSILSVTTASLFSLTEEPESLYGEETEGFSMDLESSNPASPLQPRNKVNRDNNSFNLDSTIINEGASEIISGDTLDIGGDLASETLNTAYPPSRIKLLNRSPPLKKSNGSTLTGQKRINNLKERDRLFDLT